MRRLIRTAFILFFAWALLCLALWAGQVRLVYFPDPEMGAPEDYGLPGVSRLTLPTPDGEALEVWWAPARPGMPTVLYFQGNAGNLGHRAPLFREFQDMGLGLAALGYRGYGNSTGRPGVEALRADARLLLEHLNEHLGVPDADIIVYGESLGTGLATGLAVERELGGLVIQSGYASTLEHAKRAAPLVPVGLLFTERLDNLGLIGEVREPILIIHGERDALFPVETARRLGEAASPPVEPVIIPGAGHNIDPAEIAPRLKAFMLRG